LEIHNETIKNDYVFATPSPYLKVCANKEQMKEYLSNQSQIKYNNCSDICFIKDIKLDFEKNECIYSCKDNGYNYECNNICYNNCPEGAYTLLNNNNEEYSNNGVIICYDRNPEGYYLDKDIHKYKEFFESCKFCYGSGNETLHNCEECKFNFIFISNPLNK
jgi:hypothetical protein